MKAVNLIPAEQRSSAGIGAGRSEGAIYVVLGLLALLAVFALLYGRAAHQVSSRKAQIATLTAQTQSAQARAAALAPYTSFAAMREQRVQAVTTLVSSRFDWARAFRELGRVLPTDVSLSSLVGTVGSATGAGASTTVTSAGTVPTPGASGAGASGASASSVASATPPGSVPTVTLTGCTTSQAQVAVTLTRLRLIAGVSEVALHTSTKSGSSGGGGGSSGGSCTGNAPQFTIQVTYEALPSVSAATSGPRTVPASTGAAAPATGASR